MAHSALSIDVVPGYVVRICETLRSRGFRAWIVGGCVRDILLGREVSDWDVCTDALPDQIMASFRQAIPTGIDFGTVTVVMDKEPVEVTTLRGDGDYLDGRRPESVNFVASIDADLARRDFTVNAMAWDPSTAVLSDPFGGQEDLNARLIRSVGNAETRFREDGLRVLRAARFVATLEFELHPDTFAAVARCHDVFRKVAKERVRDEWVKAMKARVPSRAFEVMRQTDLLAEICPLLIEQVGCTQNRYHAYDVWTHTMRTLDETPPNLVLRTAAVLHDIGKPRTRGVSEKTGDVTFFEHEKIGALLADEWLKEYRFSNDERAQVVHLIFHHLVAYSPEWSDAAVRRFIRRIGEHAINDVLALARADTRGKGVPVDDAMVLFDALEARIEALLKQKPALSTKQLAVSGKDLLDRRKLPPGPWVGKMLDTILERVIDSPELNAREELLQWVDTLPIEGK